MPIKTRKELRLKQPHQCFLCHEPIAIGPAIRITWMVSRLGGIGYFHTGLCANALQKAIREAEQAS